MLLKQCFFILIFKYKAWDSTEFRFPLCPATIFDEIYLDVKMEGDMEFIQIKGRERTGE